MSDFLFEPVIRFRCGGCTQLMEVPERHAGKKFRCPACFKESIVPQKSIEETPPEDLLYGVEHIPSDTRDILKGQSFITFPCTTCFTNISIPPKDADQTFECPECGTMNHVPQSLKPGSADQMKQSPAIEKTVEVYGVSGGNAYGLSGEKLLEFPVHCPMCGTLLYARENQIGTILKCLDCEHDVPIRESDRPKKKDEFKPKFYEGGTDFAVLEGEKPPPNVKLIPVVCSLCQTRMYATVDQAGQEKECPDCGRMNPIVMPPDEKLLTVEELFPAHGEYTVDAKPPKRPMPRINVDYRTVEGSLVFREPQPTDGEDLVLDPEIVNRDSPEERKKKRKKKFEEEAAVEPFGDGGEVKNATFAWERPKPPAWPFVTRFWKMFTYSALVMKLGVSAFILFLGLPLVHFVLTQDAGVGSAHPLYSVAYLFRLVIGFVLTFGAVAYLCSTLLAIFSTTSNGGDEVADWEPFSIAGGILNCYFFGIAILAGLLPELLYRMYLSLSGLNTELPWLVSLGSGVLACFLFPVVLMLILEGSTLNFFKSGVFRSFIAVPSAWTQFYMLSLPLIAICGFLFYRTFFGDAWNAPNAMVALLAFLIPLFAAMYFRLLGRLGWVIEDAIGIPDDEEEEEDTDERECSKDDSKIIPPSVD